MNVNTLVALNVSSVIAGVDLSAKFVGIVIENTSFNVVVAMCKFVRTVEETAYDLKERFGLERVWLGGNTTHSSERIF